MHSLPEERILRAASREYFNPGKTAIVQGKGRSKKGWSCSRLWPASSKTKMRVPFGFSGRGRSGGGAATVGSRGRGGTRTGGWRCGFSAGRATGDTGARSGVGTSVRPAGSAGVLSTGGETGGETGRSVVELCRWGSPSRRERNAARPRNKTVDMPKIAASSSKFTRTDDVRLRFPPRFADRREFPPPFAGRFPSRPLPPFFRRSIRYSRYGQTGHRVNLSYTPSREVRPNDP